MNTPAQTIRLNGQPYHLGPLLGQGKMGQVFQIIEEIEGRPWVAKVALTSNATTDDALAAEYALLTSLANADPGAPPVPRVLFGQMIGADGRAQQNVLGMEEIGERYQLALLIQQSLASRDLQAEKQVVWLTALSYLDLLETLYREIGRSVTDRKLADLRALPGQPPRLVVLDWGLVDARKDELNDIAIFTQLWFSMVTGQSVPSADSDTLYPLHYAWGDSLSVAGRILLRQCVLGQFRTVAALSKAIQALVDTMSPTREGTLRGRISELPPDADEARWLEALADADLVARLNPATGTPLLTDLTRRYTEQFGRVFERVRQQAGQRLQDAQTTLAALADRWKYDNSTYLMLLTTWQSTLRDLAEMDAHERQALGGQFASQRNWLLAIRDRLTKIYAAYQTNKQYSIDDIQSVITDIEASADRVGVSADAQPMRQRAKTLLLEAELLRATLDAERFLRNDAPDDAAAALRTALARADGLPAALTQPLQTRLGALEAAANLELGFQRYTDSMTQAIAQGAYRQAVENYQRAALSHAFSAYQRLCWQTLAEPAFLMCDAEAGSLSPAAWVGWLGQMQRYLNRPDASSQVARRALGLLNTPYEVFAQKMKSGQPSADIEALQIGQLIQDVYTRCQSVIGAA